MRADLHGNFLAVRAFLSANHYQRNCGDIVENFAEFQGYRNRGGGRAVVSTLGTEDLPVSHDGKYRVIVEDGHEQP